MALDLGQITEKESFFKKVKNSLASRLVILLSAGAFAFAGCGDTEDDCLSTLNTVCKESTVYYLDTCGNPGIIKEHCDCGCNEDSSECKTPCNSNIFSPQKYLEFSKYNHHWQPLEGCTGKPDWTPCDDGNLCSIIDRCQKGECVGALPKECPAPNPCLLDGTCDSETGDCIYPDAPNGVPCPDKLWCNGLETCCGGICIPGEPACDTPCDEEHRLCVDEGGCVYDSDCDDGIMCNGEEWCCTWDKTDWHCDKYRCYDGISPCGQPIWGVLTVCDCLFDDPCYDACRPCEADYECDDGCFCNGYERCGTEEEAHHWGVCMHAVGSRPCTKDELCNEEKQSCGPLPGCWRDSDCPDYDSYCTTALCDVNGKCQTINDNPCGDDYICDEENDICILK